MPSALVDDQHCVSHVRADGSTTTRGQARAYFAREWGDDFTEVRVSKVYMLDPGPLCDCGDDATCGLVFRDGGFETKSMMCAECQTAELADGENPRTGLTLKPCSLEDAQPYDGWPLISCERQTPGATPYWQREEPDAV